MENIIIYKGKPYTKCGFANLYVNNYGIGAVSFADTKITAFSSRKMPKFIPWQTRKSDGKRYIRVDKTTYELDRLIGRYCGDHNGFHGQDGRAWDVSYIDGNPEHCYQQNLEWILRPHHTDIHTGLEYVELNFEDGSIRVFSNGDVYRNGTKETPASNLIDPDTNLWYVVDPYYNFSWQGEKHNADEIMVCGNFVNGESKVFKQPVVLHRDLDFKNFASDNLEWCDASDARYIEYQEKKAFDKKTAAAELNK